MDWMVENQDQLGDAGESFEGEMSYDADLDVNADGVVNQMDLDFVRDAWEESSVWDRLNPFETETVEEIEEVIPETEIVNYEEIMESIQAGDGKYDINDLLKAQEEGAITVIPAQKDVVIGETVWEPAVFEPGYSEELPDRVIETSTVVEGTPEKVLTFPGEDKTPDWDALTDASKDAYIASRRFKEGMPDEWKNMMAQFEYQKETDFLANQRIEPWELSMFEQQNPGFGFPGTEDFYYNIKGEEYWVDKPLDWYDDLYEDFSGDWEKRYRDMFLEGDIYKPYTETLPGADPLTINRTFGIPQGRTVGPELVQPDAFYPEVLSTADIPLQSYVTPEWSMEWQPPTEYISKDVTNITGIKPHKAVTHVGEKFGAGLDLFGDKVAGLTPWGDDPWSTWKSMFDVENRPKSAYEEFTGQSPLDVMLGGQNPIAGAGVTGIKTLFPNLTENLEGKALGLGPEQGTKADQMAYQMAYYGTTPDFEYWAGDVPEINPYLLRQLGMYV